MTPKLLLFLLILSAPLARAADPTLWRIGKADGSAGEFTAKAHPKTYAVPADWNTRTAWPEWPGVSHGDWEHSATWDLTCDVTYELTTVPAHGAQFTFKTLNASSHVPQLAVFSNGTPCGVIQMIGTTWFRHDPKQTPTFGDTHRIYIPKEFLRAGANTLRLRKLEHPYKGGMAYLSFSYDFMQLEALAAPAAEPIHSRRVSLAAQGSAGGGFNLNDDSVTHDPKLLRWLGCAYSGNTQRATFWASVWDKQPRRKEYAQMLRDLNMGVLVGHYSNVKEKDLVNGDLSPKAKTDITNFFKSYGSYFQQYELSNEPCYHFSDESLTGMKRVAEFVKTIRPAHVQIVAPGYAYGSGAGVPKDWDKDAKLRAELEALCDATNGHAYGDSYRAAKGGNFFETLKTYGNGRFTDGFPKPFVNSEFGTADQDGKENDDLKIPTPRASLFDRMVRAHLAFADHSVYYSFWGNEGGDHGLIKGKLNDPSKWQVRTIPAAKKIEGEVPKWTILRQYVLAYATHGAPLPHVYLNAEEVANQLVYFRAVDTSKLAPLPGSGGKSSKVLLNFVNFDKAPRAMKVRVTLPAAGTYRGERFGPELSYAAAVTNLELTANPQVDLEVNLGPRESVQYILEAAQ